MEAWKRFLATAFRRNPPSHTHLDFRSPGTESVLFKLCSQLGGGEGSFLPAAPGNRHTSEKRQSLADRVQKARAIIPRNERGGGIFKKT